MYIERYGNYNKLAEITAQYLRKEISISAFEEELNRLLSLVRESVVKLESLPDDEININNELINFKEKARIQISMFEKGIKKVRNYIYSNSLSDIIDGLDLVKDASIELNKILKALEDKEDK